MADSYLRRLAANDPQLVDIRVHTDQGAEYAEALEGNTHVRELKVTVHDLPEYMTSWLGFCRVAGELSSLKTVRIVFETPTTPQMYVAVDLLLQHLRQVKVIQLDAYGRFRISDPAYGRIIADNIKNHPSLEEFSLEILDCTRAGSSLAIVLEALLTVPNLKSVFYSPDVDQRLLVALGRNYLGRLMRKQSLESITFCRIAFTPSHIEEMASAIKSPETQLQAIAFESCSLPVEAAPSFFDGVAGSTCLQDLSLAFTTLSGFDFNVHANLLSPLSSSKSLKKLHLQLRVGGGQKWPRLAFLRTNSVLESLKVEFPFLSFNESITSLLEDELRPNSKVKILSFSGRSLHDGHRNSLARMIHDNVGLKEIGLCGNYFTKETLRTLVPSLVQNTSLQRLFIRPRWGKRVNGTDEFVRAVLSQTELRELMVGPWDAKDPKPLLMIAAKNYHIERLEFAEFEHCDYSDNTGAYHILKATIGAITKLNKAGRGYLAGDRNKMCKAAGVSVLSKVSDDLDCIFYHLRENPLLCDLDCRRGGGASEKSRPADTLGTATSQQEGRDTKPLTLPNLAPSAMPSIPPPFNDPSSILGGALTNGAAGTNNTAPTGATEENNANAQDINNGSNYNDDAAAADVMAQRLIQEVEAVQGIWAQILQARIAEAARLDALQVDVDETVNAVGLWQQQQQQQGANVNNATGLRNGDGAAEAAGGGGGEQQFTL